MRRASRAWCPWRRSSAWTAACVSVRVLSAQVAPEFAASAVTAVKQWKFTPTLLNGVPVEVQMTVSVSFSLTD